MANTVANLCHLKSAALFKKGISTQAVASGASTKGGGAATVSPLVKVSVQSKKGKVAACAANGLAAEVVKKLGVYPAAKIKNLKAQIALDNAGHPVDPGGARESERLRYGQADPPATLRSDQLDKTTNSQLLLLAKTVESPYVLAPAASNKITARSRRNTVVIGALIGLILGALAALLWEPVASRVTPRNGEVRVSLSGCSRTSGWGSSYPRTTRKL